MKTQELLELAALDALGLLDEAERDAFDRAFRAAPPALQAQIRKEQTRIAGDDSLLPSVEPPLGLRARVLAAWKEAVGAVATHRGGRASPGLRLANSRGVNPIWRAGAIGCAAASIVLAVAMVNIRGEFERYARTSEDIVRQQQWAEEFGARFERLYTAPTTRPVQFVPSSSDVKIEAMLLIDPTTKTGHLYARQLPESPGGFALVALDANGKPVLDDNGQIVKLCVIHSTGSDSGSAFNERIKIEPGTEVGLIQADQNPAQAKLLLRGRNL